MTQNFMYMFEFVVDDLLVTRPNCCAPEEYPTCVEITFRKCVFVSISDREYGKCVDLCNPKCCKCCLFSLDSPVTEEDRLLVHIYKKKDNKCKFLIGVGVLPISELFEQVMLKFEAINPNWLKVMNEFINTRPDPKSPSKMQLTNCFECDYCHLAGRPEQMCPTKAMTKKLLPIFNLKVQQTGNLVMIVSLACHGPNIVSCYPYSKMCKTGCLPLEGLCTDVGKCGGKPMCSSKIVDEKSSEEEEEESKKDCQCQTVERMTGGGGSGYCEQPDPCYKESTKMPCKRYFACNTDKGCPCSDCEDEFDRECPTGCEKEREEEKKKKESCCCSPPPPPSPCCKKKPPPCCCTPSSPPPSCCPKTPPCCKKPKPKEPKMRKCELCEFTKGENQCCCENCKEEVEPGM